MSKQLIFSAKKKDFRVDTYRATGKGGQNVNKRDTAVRITHHESRLSASCQEHRTQARNKKEAFRKLCDKLVKHYTYKDTKKRYAAGKEEVRVYNEPDNRVTNKKTGNKFSYGRTVGRKDLSELIEDNLRNE